MKVIYTGNAMGILNLGRPAEVPDTKSLGTPEGTKLHKQNKAMGRYERPEIRGASDIISTLALQLKLHGEVELKDYRLVERTTAGPDRYKLVPCRGYRVHACYSIPDRAEPWQKYEDLVNNSIERESGKVVIARAGYQLAYLEFTSAQASLMIEGYARVKTELLTDKLEAIKARIEAKVHA